MGAAQLGQTGMAQLGIGALVPSDDRNVQRDFQWAWAVGRLAQSPWADGQLWPATTGLGGGISGYGCLDQDAGTAVQNWEVCGGTGWNDTGGQKQNVIVGQTLDSGGNPLANANVEGFVTSTNQPVGVVQSDSAGYFRLPTPYGTGVAQYLVCYKAGSPDVAGTSVNTLLPTATG